MKNWTKSALAVSVCAFAAQGVSAQSVAGNAQSRGVVVLRPTAEPSPLPGPPPSPAPVARPTAKPGPAVLPAPIVKACPRPFPRPDLALNGDADFDRRLKSRLGGRRALVVVDLARPYPIDGVPPAPLAGWLDAIKTSGGGVSVQIYCQTSRGLFGNFFKKMFAGPPSDPLYKPAAGYDAVLQIDGLDQNVTQVSFSRRAGK